MKDHRRERLRDLKGQRIIRQWVNDAVYTAVYRALGHAVIDAIERDQLPGNTYAQTSRRVVNAPAVLQDNA